MKSNSFSNVELKARPGEMRSTAKLQSDSSNPDLLSLPPNARGQKKRRTRVTFDKDADVRKSFDGNDSIDSSEDDPYGPVRSYFGVEVKRGYGFWQFLALPVLSTSIVVVIAYVNAQLAYMLEDHSMFDAPAD